MHIPTRAPHWATGSKLLRDVFVVALAGAVTTPLLWIAPGVVVPAAGAWVAAFLTPLPRWALGRMIRVRGQGRARMTKSDHRGAARFASDHRGAARFAQVAVLGGGFRQDGELSERTVRRLRQGLELAAAQGAALLLCGGATSRGRTEAEAMAGLARESGWMGDIHLEGRSCSTLENLLALGALCQRQGREPVVLVVTCPHHLPRIRRLARALALPVVPACYPPEHLPAGLGGRLGLLWECSYECAIHAWLSLRSGLVRLGLLPPLDALRRDHLL